MHNQKPPAFPPEWQALVDQAANALRELALNEDAKASFCNDPLLRPFMHRVARRYVAGQTTQDVLERISQINARGHAASAEYMGESCRDEARANAETEVFLALLKAIDGKGLTCSVSLDLSHIGSVIDPELGFLNARKIACAAAAIGREVMISMEGSERADNIYATYARLHADAELANVGITLPARLHRSAHDLPKLMAYPGRIRLVKGAFLEPEQIAYSRNSPELAASYRRYAAQLLGSGHKCSIATHDRAIQEELTDLITRQGLLGQQHYEFESLIGLGTEQIDGLQKRGFPTREYAVYGEEYFLYVLNRIAEEPVRLYQALLDIV
ncbi:proline dehydrogenase family protein [Collimonas sp.]|jgi:proline dehydrogenase|uniref:proline dehydrogenase family protein n=1 Tax=Collimonas sp. TaxID=1963772 RepID=UPI002C4EC523|nr:proline dehydrogenase family protein [Collimonas sp.]HWW04780.1 proline dehydrogenase family protein [Collimonas sp.]